MNSNVKSATLDFVSTGFLPSIPNALWCGCGVFEQSVALSWLYPDRWWILWLGVLSCTKSVCIPYCCSGITSSVPSLLVGANGYNDRPRPTK